MTKKQTRKAKRAQKKPYRIQHRFWLDITRDDEFELDEQLSVEKKRRGFASTLRSALRLWFDLMAGNTDVLCELFPWIQVRLMNGAGDKTDVLRQLERMEAMMKESKVIPLFDDNGAVMKAGEKLPEASDRAQEAPRQLAGTGRKLTIPIDDDDDTAGVVVKKKEGDLIGANFLASLDVLQQSGRETISPGDGRPGLIVSNSDIQMNSLYPLFG
jgi:hypothetical protein